MPAWKFDEDVVEDTRINEIHMASCLKAPADGQLHAAGTVIVRRVIPKRCWTCWPKFELTLTGA